MVCGVAWSVVCTAGNCQIGTLYDPIGGNYWPSSVHEVNHSVNEIDGLYPVLHYETYVQLSGLEQFHPTP